LPVPRGITQWSAVQPGKKLIAASKASSIRRPWRFLMPSTTDTTSESLPALVSSGSMVFVAATDRDISWWASSFQSRAST
jgi:hypothetical protein